MSLEVIRLHQVIEPPGSAAEDFTVKMVCEVTGAEPAQARRALAAAQNDVEAAVQSLMQRDERGAERFQNGNDNSGGVNARDNAGKAGWQWLGGGVRYGPVIWQGRLKHVCAGHKSDTYFPLLPHE